MRPGGGFPPCDVVRQMVVCYGAPQLAYEHLRETTGLLSYVVPELEPRGVLEEAVHIYLALDRLMESRSANRLLELAEGGRVDAAAQAEFNRIVSSLWQLVRPCLELGVYWRGGRQEENGGQGKRRRP